MTPLRSLVSNLALVVLLLGRGAVAFPSRPLQDYIQWRGPNRDGAASGFVRPAHWPDHLRLRWEVDVGEGYATPLVVGRRVFAFVRRNGKEALVALSAETGKVIWKTEYPAPYEPVRPAAAHGAGPKATPVFSDGKIFSLGISGIVSAFDAVSGRLLWQKPGPSTPPTYGSAVSPLTYQGMVIIHVADEGPLTALDARTGEIRWLWKGDSPSFASPVIAELGGVHQIVTVTLQKVVGVSPTDGRLLWEYPWVSSATPSAITPILYKDSVLVSGQSMGVAALKPGIREGKWSVDVRWHIKEASLFLSNPVLVGETLFGLSERSSGQFFALDAETGKVLWLGHPREATNTAVVRAGDLLFLLNDDAELIIAKASRTGFEQLKRYTVADSPTWAQPAISGGRVFVKDVESLSLWTFE